MIRILLERVLLRHPDAPADAGPVTLLPLNGTVSVTVTLRLRIRSFTGTSTLRFRSLNGIVTLRLLFYLLRTPANPNVIPSNTTLRLGLLLKV